MKFRFALLIGVFAFLKSMAPLHAITPQDLLTVNTETLSQSMVRSIAIGTSHRPLMPATPLGLKNGFELGVALSAVTLDADVSKILGDLVDFKGYPPLLPVPTLLFRKGLHSGINFGISGMTYKDYYYVGGDLQFSYPPRIDRPAVALRFSSNYIHLPYMTARTHSADVLISKSTATSNKIFSTDPYLGVGLIYLSGNATIPVPNDLSVVPGVPTQITGSISSARPRAFVGIPFRMSILNFTPEYSFTEGGISTYGIKLSILVDDALFTRSNTSSSSSESIGWDPPPLW